MIGRLPAISHGLSLIPLRNAEIRDGDATVRPGRKGILLLSTALRKILPTTATAAPGTMIPAGRGAGRPAEHRLKPAKQLNAKTAAQPGRFAHLLSQGMFLWTQMKTG